MQASRDRQTDFTMISIKLVSLSRDAVLKINIHVFIPAITAMLNGICKHVASQEHDKRKMATWSEAVQ